MINVTLDVAPFTDSISTCLGVAEGIMSKSSLNLIAEGVAVSTKLRLGETADAAARAPKSRIAHVYRWRAIDDEYYGETNGAPTDRLWDLRIGNIKDGSFMATVLFMNNSTEAPIPPALDFGVKNSRHVFSNSPFLLERYRTIRSRPGQSKYRTTEAVPRILIYIKGIGNVTGADVSKDPDGIVGRTRGKLVRDNHYHLQFTAFTIGFFRSLFRRGGDHSKTMIPSDDELASIVRKEAKRATAQTVGMVYTPSSAINLRYEEMGFRFIRYKKPWTGQVIYPDIVKRNKLKTEVLMSKHVKSLGTVSI